MSAESDLAGSLAQALSTNFARLPGVVAVALGGSQASGAASPGSDIDLYVFTTTPIPLSERAQLAAARGFSRADLGLDFWDPGDEWMDDKTGIEVDVIYWDCAWIQDQLDRVLIRHQASMGYTTCFWNTIAKALTLADPQGWFARLQAGTQVDYPEELRLNIIRQNHAVLRRVIPSYTHQLEKALLRQDWVSINHRVAALLASYFDVLFALNRVLHPGEKRLSPFARRNCPLLPTGFSEEIECFLQSASAPAHDLMNYTNSLLDHLDDLLLSQGFDPKTSAPK